MSLKKTELYRGFNVFTEEVRPGAWVFSLVEVPADPGEHRRSPQQGRMPGEHASREAAVAAARAHVDRIQQNRRNRSQG
jgi:hypothetical protein